MFEKEEDKYVKERNEEVLENLDNLEKKKKIRKILVTGIIVVFVIIVLFLIFSFYTYFKSPENTLGLGANIESVLLSENGKTAYIKLAGGSLDKNITKIKFIFNDLNENEYNYETSEGIKEIEVPYSRSFWDWLFGRQFFGSYDYSINSENAGLSDFNNINQINVLFEYQTQTGDVIETPVLDTQRTTNRTTTPSGSSGTSNSGTTATTPTPSCTPNCAGKICGDNGCEGSCGSCDEGYYCNSSAQCEEILSCTHNNNCSSLSFSEIAICNNTPDNNFLTFDYAPENISVCNLTAETCTIPTQALTHTCNFTCGAMCIIDDNCLDAECDSLDGCQENDYYDYYNVENNCVDCDCEANSCENYTVYFNDARCLFDCTEIKECSNYTDPVNCTADPCDIENCEWNSGSGKCGEIPITTLEYSTNEDTPINITLMSSIIGNFIRTNSPDEGTIQNKTSQNNVNFVNITYTPDANYNGNDYFIYNVSDGTNTEVIRVDVIIVPVDDAPILMTQSYKTITSITFSVNSTLVEKAYKLLITEYDGDDLIYSVLNLPSGATLNSETGELKWTVSSANIGNYTNIIFTATDNTPAKLNSTKTINITVRQAQTYYCDPVSGNTTTGDGSSGNPWGTLQSVGEAGYFNEIKIKSGDILKLKNGYHGQLSIWKKANTDYITVESDEGAVANLTQVILKYTDYWIFRGLRMSPELAVPSRVNPGNKSSMFSGYSNRFIKIENCYMYTVENASNWTSYEWSNLTWSGIVLGYTSDCFARNNIIRNVRTGVNCGAILTENNTVDGFSGDAMYVNTNCILQDNIILNKHDPADGFHNDGIQGWSSMTKNITVRRNYINARTDPNRNDSTVGGLQGIFLEGNISGRIENNVILAKNSAWGIGLSAGTHDIYIFNNTIMRPYLIGGWPNIQMSSSAINSVVKNNIADGMPVTNTTRNITSENNLKITNYNESQILSFFVDYPHGDVRPLMNSPICNGTINPRGVAVGALPCVCTNNLQCEEVFGSGATCDINTGECVGGTVPSLSPFTKLLNFIKSLLTTKTGNVMNKDGENNENTDSKVPYILLFLLAAIILIIAVIIVKKKGKRKKKNKKRSKKKIGKR